MSDNVIRFPIPNAPCTRLRVELYGCEVRLIFNAGTPARAGGLADSIVAGIKDGPAENRDDRGARLMSADILEFPVQTSCSGCTIPGITTAELRQRARDNYYSALRREGVDCLTAFDRSEAFAADLERIYQNMQRIAVAIVEASR